MIPHDLDLGTLPGLSGEVREKLERLRPRSVGQAARIEGVTPAALLLIAAHVKAGGTRKRA